MLELQLGFLFQEQQLSQIISEAAFRKRSFKQLFENISQNSQEIISDGVFLLAKIEKNI